LHPTEIREPAIRELLQDLFLQELPGNLASLVKFVGRELIPLASVPDELLADFAQAAAVWYWVDREVLVKVEEQTGVSRHNTPDGGWLNCVFTQHPNTPHPIWVLKALKHLAMYSEAWATLERNEPHLLSVQGQSEDSSLRTILRELLWRKLVDQVPVKNVVDNLSHFLDLYADSIWLNAEFYNRKYSTWMGVDLDGQSPTSLPAADIERAGRLLRDQVITRYQQALNSIRERPSFKNDPKTEAIEALLTLLHASLEATRRGLGSPNAFPSEDAFKAQLESAAELAQSPLLKEAFQHLISKLHRFGFTFLELQPRLNATTIDFADCDPATVKWMKECFQALFRVYERNGRLSQVVLANTERPNDLIALKALLSDFGLGTTTVIPLHETEDGLGLAAENLAQHLQRDSSSEVVPWMWGFSDSTRLLGVTAWWSIAWSIADTKKVAVAHNRKVECVYGRAQNFFRGGGQLEQFRSAMPDDYNSCSVLLQGDDVLGNRLTTRISDRARARSFSPAGMEDLLLEAETRRKLEKIRLLATQKFLSLVRDPEFMELFSLASPIRYLKSVCRSVRPETRSKGVAGIELTNIVWDQLRAIGTVQAGTVLGYVPQLYGAGIALASALEDLTPLWRRSKLFRFWINGYAQELGKVDFEGFLALAAASPNAERFIELLQQDHAAATNAVSIISEGECLAEANPLGRELRFALARSHIPLMKSVVEGTTEPTYHRNASVNFVRAILACVGTNG